MSHRLRISTWDELEWDKIPSNFRYSYSKKKWEGRRKRWRREKKEEMRKRKKEEMRKRKKERNESGCCWFIWQTIEYNLWGNGEGKLAVFLLLYAFSVLFIFISFLLVSLSLFNHCLMPMHMQELKENKNWVCSVQQSFPISHFLSPPPLSLPYLSSPFSPLSKREVIKQIVRNEKGRERRERKKGKEKKMIHGSIPVLCISSGSRPFPFFLISSSHVPHAFSFALLYSSFALLFSLCDLLFLLLLQFLHHFFPRLAFRIFLFSFTAMHLLYGTSCLVSNNKSCWRRKETRERCCYHNFLCSISSFSLSLSSFFCFMRSSASKRGSEPGTIIHFIIHPSFSLPSNSLFFGKRKKEMGRDKMMRGMVEKGRKNEEKKNI